MSLLWCLTHIRLMSQSYRSELNDFHSKSIDCFLYESSIDLIWFKLLIYCTPNYLNKVFEFFLEGSIHFRNNFWIQKFFSKNQNRSKSFLICGPLLRKKIPVIFKENNNLKNVQHNLENNYFRNMAWFTQ